MTTPPTGTPAPPPPPPTGGAWPQSPAPKPAPFSFPGGAGPATGSAKPPAPTPPSAPEKTETKKKAEKKEKPKKTDKPTTAEKPKKTKDDDAGDDGRRGLFGLRFLGRKKPAEPTAPDGGGASGGSKVPSGPVEPEDEPSGGIGGFFERASVLIVLGLFALVGVSAGVYLTFFRPEPVVLAPTVHFIPLPTPSFSPSAPPGDTAFAAAFPATDLTYGLKSAEQDVWKPVKAWPSRFAEEWHLTYEDASGDTMTVQAVQHYSAADAKSAFDSFLAAAQADIASAADAQAAATPSPSTSPSPSPSATPGLVIGIVRVDGAQVGQSFTVIKDVTETSDNPDGGDPIETTRQVAEITWQNGTAVFVMTADPSVANDLYLEYGL